MKKKCKVVMLATDEKATVNSIVTRPSDNRMAIVNILTVEDAQPCIHQHLYIVSDDQIKEGDWYIDTVIKNNTIVQQCKKEYRSLLDSKCCNKIIATTDSSLGYTDHKVSPVPNFCTFPQIPQQFIKHFVSEYNKGNPITEVMVEFNDKITEIPKPYKPYAEVQHLDGTLIINQDNTINIDVVKDSWSREEVAELLEKYRIYFEFHSISNKDKWIEENL